MKLVFILGNAAVGKMTVGQELMKITGLRLFHNHMALEPIMEVFGEMNFETTNKVRKVIFEDFAKTDNYGMIYTIMFAFDQKDDWDFLESIKAIFEPYGTEFYYVELVTTQEERLKRNVTENRLNNKPSKCNIEFSNQWLIDADKKYRCESFDGEILFPNYIKIDNTNLAPDVVAQMIKERFSL